MRSAMLITSVLMMSSLGFAEPIVNKDWTFENLEQLCMASTNRTVDGQLYRLELTFDKSGESSVEVRVREVPTGSARAFLFVTETKPVQNFIFAPLQDADGTLAFWNVPSNTTAMVDYIKRQTRFRVYGLTPQGAAEPLKTTIDFSLRGSSATLDTLISQCNKKKAITFKDFDQSFVSAQVATLNPLSLSETQTSELRRHYQAALAAHAQKLLLQKELAALNTRYVKQIQELSKLTGTLDQLTQTELVTLQNQKESLEARIRALEQQIVNQQAKVKAKESEIAAANAVYDKAWQSLAPLEGEHKKLTESVQSARSDVSRAQKRLAQIEESIQNKTSEIARAERAVSDLNSQVSEVERQLSSLRNDLGRAESYYRRFDIGRERDERQREHPVFKYCRRNSSAECQSAMREVQSHIDREVNTVRDHLYRNVESIRSAMNQKESDIRRLDSSIRDYVNLKIPRLRGEISDLRSEKPGAESAISRARSEVSSRNSALQAYEQRVGYVEKKSAVDMAKAKVLGLQKELASIESEINNATKDRTQQEKNLAATDKKIEAVLLKIRQSQERSSELNQALAPYFAEKGRIEGVMSQVENAIQLHKNSFAQIVGAL